MLSNSDPNETLTYIPNHPFDKRCYLGGNVDPIDMNSTTDELFHGVINNVTDRCKTFDDESN